MIIVVLDTMDGQMEMMINKLCSHDLVNCELKKWMVKISCWITSVDVMLTFMHCCHYLLHPLLGKHNGNWDTVPCYAWLLDCWQQLNRCGRWKHINHHNSTIQSIFSIEHIQFFSASAHNTSAQPMINSCFRPQFQKVSVNFFVNVMVVKLCSNFLFSFMR